jgi:hypothetical protein
VGVGLLSYPYRQANSGLSVRKGINPMRTFNFVQVKAEDFADAFPDRSLTQIEEALERLFDGDALQQEAYNSLTLALEYELKVKD